MMSNNIVPFDTPLPAHLSSRQSVLSANIAGGLGGGSSFPRISIKGSRFRIVDGGAETVLPDVQLAVSIVWSNPNLSKSFYAEAWNPDAEATAPDCSSLGGIRPDADSAQPQNDLCASCPQNAWGSKKTPQGVDIKACADKKRLAIIAADDPEGPMYLLEVTAAALKGLNAYHRKLGMHGIIPDIAKTIISFDTEASYPKLKFDYGGILDDSTQVIVDKLLGSPLAKEITGEDAPSISIAVTPAAPVIAAPVAVPTPVAEPVAQPAPAPVAEEPAPVVSFGKPAAPAPAPVVAAVEPVVEEPVAAPTADAGTAGLADEITALMAQVEADDA